MSDAGSARRLNGNQGTTRTGSAFARTRCPAAAPVTHRLISFNPFHTKGLNPGVAAKSEVRVDE